MSHIPIMASGDSRPANAARASRDGGGACARAALLGLLVFLCSPDGARAEFQFTERAGGHYEYESNIFALPIGYPLPPGNRFSDSILSYFAGGTGAYLWGEQRLALDGSVTETHYVHDTHLNHTEYAVDAAWAWVVDPLLTGTLDVNRQRHMLPFADALPTTTLSIETVGQETATVLYRFRPVWRLEGSLSLRDEQSPTLGAPDLSTRENFEKAALLYGEDRTLSFGVGGQYASGTYSGGILGEALSYHQVTAQLQATHSAGDLGAINGAVGYTHRALFPTDASSGGLTGLLDYKRALTGKTKIHLSLVRAVNTYVATSGAELDTTASANVTWEATSKIQVNIGYSWTHSDFGVQLTPDGQEEPRVDRFRSARVEAFYRVRPWFTLHPYARFDNRDSDVADFSYGGRYIGIDFTLNHP